MESFIRSKYETRRWALEGPPPSDPSSLDSQSAPAPSTQPTQRSQPPVVSSVTTSASRSSLTTRQPQPHQLLSASVANRAQQVVSQPAPQAQQPSQPQPAAGPSDELFSLDFHAPSSTPSNTDTAPAPKKDVKQDILSLFSAPAAPAPSNFGQFAQAQTAWSAFEAQPAQQTAQPTSMMGTTGVGMWGVSSGWTAPPVAPAQPNLWANPAVQPVAQQQQSLFTTSDVWGSSGGAAASGGDLFGSSLPAMQKKDDAFGDIWGGFK